VGAKGLCLAGPPRSEETSRPDSRDPVASGVKCGPHGGKKSKTKSSTGAVDFGEECSHVPLMCDSTSAISVAKNPCFTLEPNI
jgi:hypothetical protein